MIQPIRSPFTTGLAAALRHRRLAMVLWLGLLVVSLPVLFGVFPLTKAFDDGPFRESTMKGWDSWAVLSWLLFKAREWAMFRPAIVLMVLGSILLQLFLVGGLIRTLMADVRRPVFRRVISESAALFRPSLWAFARYLVTLLLWEGAVVGSVLALAKKIAGENAPPNNTAQSVAAVISMVLGVVIFLNVTARFDLARIALAKDDSPTARGAYRVAKERLRGSRASAVLLLLFWIVVGLAVQALFTDLGIRMNPQTDAGVFWLVVVRQVGFIVLAMTRVGLWGSLLAWEAARRPVPLPMPSWRTAHVEAPRVVEVAADAPAPVPEEPILPAVDAGPESAAR